MNVIVIVDNNYGMLFNHRRLSKDKILIEKILSLSKHTTLRMNNYSKELFPDSTNIVISDDFLDKADAGDICFVEDRELLPYQNKIDTFYLFQWNNIYPSDLKLDFIPALSPMQLRKTESIKGSAHNLILEIWQK